MCGSNRMKQRHTLLMVRGQSLGDCSVKHSHSEFSNSSGGISRHMSDITNALKNMEQIFLLFNGRHLPYIRRAITKK